MQHKCNNDQLSSIMFTGNNDINTSNAIEAIINGIANYTDVYDEMIIVVQPFIFLY